MRTSRVAYYVRDATVIFDFCPHPHSVWPRLAPRAGANGVAIVDALREPGPWDRYFTRVQELRPLVVLPHGPRRTFRLFRLSELTPPADCRP